MPDVSKLAPTSRAVVVAAAALVLNLVACSSALDVPPADAGTDGAIDAPSDAVIPGCALGFLGDPGKPVEMKLIVRGTNEKSTEIADGARLPLILPPQGGRVLFVGVIATNISACAVKITGSVRDLANQQVRLDARTVNLQATGGGWGASVDSDVSSFSNVPMCPNQWATSDIFEEPFELAVSVSDALGHSATKTLNAVVPFCAEPAYEAECLCQCQKGYVLGQVCRDGG